MAGWRLWALLVATAIGVLLLGALDYLSGPEISFSVFYLGPIALAVWYGRRWMGLVLAVFAAVVWGLVESASQVAYSSALIPVWNSAVRLSFFVVTVLLLDALRRIRNREREMALTDGLTGLQNTRAFYLAVSQEFARSRRGNSPLALAYLDLDHFKTVNDTLGHSAGDELLRAVAAALGASVREVDAVARLGGDEFGIMMPDTGVAGAQTVLERAGADVTRALSSVPGDTSGLGVTVGAMVFEQPPDSVDAAIAEVDRLMYEGKRRGRGHLEVQVWSAGGATNDG